MNISESGFILWGLFYYVLGCLMMYLGMKLGMKQNERNKLIKRHNEQIEWIYTELKKINEEQK